MSTAENADAVAVTEGLFRLLPAPPGELPGIVLIGGWSPTSQRHHFPLASRCPYSGAADVEEVELPTTGRLLLWTAVESAPPGYHGPVPYGFGVVALDDIDLQVVTRLTEADPARLHEDDAVSLVADPLHTDEEGTSVLAWAFAPR